MPYATKMCQWCGKPYRAYYSPKRPLSRSKYCSRECGNKAKGQARHNSALESHICPICGKIFQCTNGHSGQFPYRMTCSEECHKKLKIQRAHESRTANRVLTIACEQCGKAFQEFKSRMDGRHHFCSRDCYYEWVHEQGTVVRTCKICGKEYEVTKGQIEHRGSNYCSLECAREGLSKNYRGAGNPNWRGGDFVTDYGPNWGRQKRKAKRRDKHTCQKCGYKSGGDRILDVHHIVPIKEFNGDWKRANRLSNLICLCRNCHFAIEFGDMECPEL